MNQATFLRVAACAVAAGAMTSGAHAFMASLNALGQGSVRAEAWVFPNHPPQTPSFSLNSQEPVGNLGPELPGADPRTRVFFVGQGGQGWHAQAGVRAASGDTVDWHSMLPFVTATTADAEGSMEIVGQITGPNSATFTVTWSATDPGVAMHIGWFEGETELLDSPIMVGPFSQTDVFSIVSSGPIQLVDMEASAAAVSIPAPSVGAVLGLAGLVGLRRRRA